MDVHDIMSQEVDRIYKQQNSGFSLSVAERVARMFWGANDDVKFQIRQVKLNSVDFFVKGSVQEFKIWGSYHFKDNQLISVAAEKLEGGL